VGRTGPALSVDAHQRGSKTELQHWRLPVRQRQSRGTRRESNGQSLHARCWLSPSWCISCSETASQSDSVSSPCEASATERPAQEGDRHTAKYIDAHSSRQERTRHTHLSCWHAGDGLPDAGLARWRGAHEETQPPWKENSHDKTTRNSAKKVQKRKKMGGNKR